MRAAGLLPSGKVLLAALLASTLAGVAFAAIFGRDSSPAEAIGSCEPDDVLYVTADPAIAPTLSSLADRFMAEVKAVDRCVQIETRAMSARDAATALLGGWDTAANGQPPDVWVPDSWAWMEVLLSEGGDASMLPDESAVIARSPLIFAVPEPMANAMSTLTARWRDLLSLPDLERGWGEYEHPEWGQPRLAVADPLTSTSGLLTLLSLGVAQDEIWAGGPTGDAAINIENDLGVLRFQRAVASVAPDARTQLRRYLDADDPLLEFSGLPLLEREMWLFNRGEMSLPEVTEEGSPTGPLVRMEEPPAIKLKAMYPTEGAFGADYSFVVMNGDWVDAPSVQTADEFVDYLMMEECQARFEAAGFRRSDNSSNSVHRTENGLRRALGGDLQPLPGAEVVSSVRRSWRNVNAPSKTLMIVDVSGSMNVEVAGGNQTRLDATITAAVHSLDVLPISSEVGLWEFSTGLPGGANDGDYRELVPLGPLDEQLENADRKTQIGDALTSLHPRNDTALNDTALAAYKSMQSSYEQDVRHTIVLMTDGRNDDPGSISNDAVIAELERMQDEERPVRIVVIAYREETDIAQMERVAAATDGKVLASPNAKDLEACSWRRSRDPERRAAACWWNNQRHASSRA